MQYNLNLDDFKAALDKHTPQDARAQMDPKMIEDCFSNSKGVCGQNQKGKTSPTP